MLKSAIWSLLSLSLSLCVCVCLCVSFTHGINPYLPHICCILQRNLFYFSDFTAQPFYQIPKVSGRLLKWINFCTCYSSFLCSIVIIALCWAEVGESWNSEYLAPMGGQLCGEKRLYGLGGSSCLHCSSLLRSRTSWWSLCNCFPVLHNITQPPNQRLFLLTMPSRKVDFRALAASAEFLKFEKASSELQRVITPPLQILASCSLQYSLWILTLLIQVDLTKLSYEERLAFFVNVYNTLVIHGYVVTGFPESCLEWRYYARTACYDIGGKVSLHSYADAIHRHHHHNISALLPLLKVFPFRWMRSIMGCCVATRQGHGPQRNGLLRTTRASGTLTTYQ